MSAQIIPKKGGRYYLVVDREHHNDALLVDYGKTETGTDFVSFVVRNEDGRDELHTAFNTPWTVIQDG